MIKRFIIALTGFVAVVAFLGGVKASQIQEMAGNQPPVPLTAVTSAMAEPAEWNPTINAIASLAPVQGVTISAELEGTVVEIAVENGAAVKAGDLLIRLDTMVEEAQLKAAQARADLAKLQADRAARLVAQQTISDAENDAAAAQYAQALADVAAIQASINKKTIRAPFDGRVGIRQANLGQFVNRGTPLIPLQRLDTVFVNFYVPQRYLPKLAIAQSVAVTTDAFPDQTFSATISAINPVVDQSTRNVWIQATLPNPDEQLRAGMFARVAVTLPEVQNVVVVPATAISYASYGNSVYVLEAMDGDGGGDPGLVANQRAVVIGPKRGDLVAIVEGLSGGETVATSGVFKLRNGLPVRINNEVMPSQEIAPNPRNT
ncbi:MAG: efflux RND transporter periplasmic adaptor subunit [Pirellulales bacterium]|nr:efflux RND transporter periplasmic adaptor subunit [Pirellulales bacterium]